MFRKFDHRRVLIAITVIMLTSSFFPMQKAYAAPVEIAYDNGTPFFSNNAAFAGVKFSLPTGVSSAPLLKIRFAWMNPGDPVTVHITAANHVTELTPPIPTSAAATTFTELDVSGLGIVLTGDFYVVLETAGVGNYLMDNLPNVGRSFWGTSMALLTNLDSNNILLRAVIDVPVAPVGGELIPINKAGILLPFVALIVTLGVIAVWTLVINQRKQTERNSA